MADFAICTGHGRCLAIVKAFSAARALLSPVATESLHRTHRVLVAKPIPLTMKGQGRE
jgi:hypothetical protein